MISPFPSPPSFPFFLLPPLFISPFSSSPSPHTYSHTNQYPSTSFSFLTQSKQRQVMMSCLKDLTRLCALYLSIPDLETGCFSISMDEIALFLSSFCELSEVNLIVPKPCPSSATTTPRSSMDLSSQRQFCYGLPYARADPTMVFKNALDQNIYGRVKWSVRWLSYC